MVCLCGPIYLLITSPFAFQVKRATILADLFENDFLELGGLLRTDDANAMIFDGKMKMKRL